MKVNPGVVVWFRKVRLHLAIALYNFFLPKELTPEERDEIFVWRLQRNKTFQRVKEFIVKTKVPDLKLEHGPIVGPPDRVVESTNKRIEE